VKKIKKNNKVDKNTKVKLIRVDNVSVR